MASIFSTIGLPADSDDELFELANRVGSRVEPFAVSGGEYFRWSDPSGAEIWLQINANKQLVAMNPHYAGRSAVQVDLTARLASAGPSELEGSFHGWATTGSYPFVFDAPDYLLHDELSLPAQKQVQIAAFAHKITAFETVAAYEASQTDDVKYASQSFLPSGLFTPADDPTARPQAQAIFTGHVVAAEEKINGLTGHPFYWALVDTLGGAFDVVIDFDLLPAVPTIDGVLSGSFWLSGRVRP